MTLLWVIWRAEDPKRRTAKKDANFRTIARDTNIKSIDQSRVYEIAFLKGYSRIAARTLWSIRHRAGGWRLAMIGYKWTGIGDFFWSQQILLRLKYTSIALRDGADC